MKMQIDVAIITHRLGNGVMAILALGPKVAIQTSLGLLVPLHGAN